MLNRLNTPVRIGAKINLLKIIDLQRAKPANAVAFLKFKSVNFNYKNKREAWPLFCFYGRGDKIRTCDFYVPNVALYQAEPHLDYLIFYKHSTFGYVPP